MANAEQEMQDLISGGSDWQEGGDTPGSYGIGTLPNMPAGQAAPVQPRPIPGGLKQIADDQGNVIAAGQSNQPGYWNPQTGRNENILDPNDPTVIHDKYRQYQSIFPPAMADSLNRDDMRFAGQTPPQQAMNSFMAPKQAAQQAVAPTAKSTPTGDSQIGNSDQIGNANPGSDMNAWFKQVGKNAGGLDRNRDIQFQPELQPYPQAAPTQAPQAVPPQLSDQEFQNQRWRTLTQANDDAMNRQQQQLNGMGAGDKMNNFFSRVVMPIVGGMSRNPNTQRAYQQAGAGLDAQTNSHALAQQKLNERRTAAAKEAFDQMSDQEKNDLERQKEGNTRRHYEAGDTLAQNKYKTDTEMDARKQAEVEKKNAADAENEKGKLAEATTKRLADAREADNKLKLEKDKLQVETAKAVTAERNGQATRAETQAKIKQTEAAIVDLDTKHNEFIAKQKADHQKQMNDYKMKLAEMNQKKQDADAKLTSDNQRYASETVMNKKGKQQPKYSDAFVKKYGLPEDAGAQPDKGNAVEDMLTKFMAPRDQVMTPLGPAPAEYFSGQGARAAAPKSQPKLRRVDPAQLLKEYSREELLKYASGQ